MPKRKNDDFEALLKRNLKGKSSLPKWKKLPPNHHSQLSRSHYNAIDGSHQQNTQVLRLQLQQRETFTQQFHCNLRTLRCKQKNCPHQLHKVQLFAAPKLDSRCQSGKNDDFEALLQRNLKGKSLLSKWEKFPPNHHSQLSCNHHNMIYDPQLQNTIVPVVPHKAVAEVSK